MELVSRGEKWKQVRSTLSPAFTSGKLKAMVANINRVGGELVEHLSALADRGQDFNVKEVMASFTMDVVADCGFGFRANSFKDPDNAFRKTVQKLLAKEISCLCLCL